MSTRNREALIRAVAESYSIRGVLLKLGLAASGGNYESVKKAIRTFGIDSSHFTGQGHLKGKTHDYSKRPLPQILKRGKLEHTSRLRRRLVKGDGNRLRSFAVAAVRILRRSHPVAITEICRPQSGTLHRPQRRTTPALVDPQHPDPDVHWRFVCTRFK